MTIDLKELRLGSPLKSTIYWCAEKSYYNSQQNKFRGSLKEAVQVLGELITQSVNDQELSDVPLGTFLSGGVDSSIITSALQKKSSKPVSTFTIGFEENEVNEAPLAKEISKFIGSEHTELYLSSESVFDFLPKLRPFMMNHLQTLSQIPTYFLSKLAKTKVTVSMSGDGGDELFGGYNRYVWIPKINQISKLLPNMLSNFVSHKIKTSPPDKLDKMLGIIVALGPNRLKKSSMG